MTVTASSYVSAVDLSSDEIKDALVKDGGENLSGDEFFGYLQGRISNADLTAVASTAAQTGQSKFNTLIANAVNEADGYLQGRALVESQKDIHVMRIITYHLLGLSLIEMTDYQTNIYKMSVQFLRDVGMGKISAAEVSSDGETVVGGQEADIQSEPSVFSRRALRDF